MGKSKGKKFRSKQSNPTGLTSLKELEETESILDLDVKAGSIDSIIDKLQSRKAEDKECAATLIGNMVQDPGSISSLIEAGAVKIAAPHLLDRSPAVRHATAGCLRNVAVCGDYTVCEEMVKQDVMTCLVALLEQYKDPWTPLDTKNNSIEDSRSQIFIEACTLLWNLCENSEKAVKIFNEKNLVSILLPCLNIQIYGIKISLIAAKCLYTVGDNNPKLIEVFREPLIQEQIRALMTLTPVDQEHHLLRTLAAGIKLNSYYAKLNDCMTEVTVSILEVVCVNLDGAILPPMELLCEEILSLKEVQSNKLREEGELEMKIISVDKIQQQIVHMFSAKKISLEILGNIFGDDSCSEEDDWLSSSASDASGDICDMDVEKLEPIMGMINLNQRELCNLPPTVLGALTEKKLLAKVSKQIIIPSDQLLEITEKFPKAKDCLKRLDSLRCTALLCLNNMIQKLDIDMIGGPSKLLELWLHIANLLFKKTDPANTEQLEAASHFMSSVLDRLAESECTAQFRSMTVPDIEFMIGICAQSQDSMIRVNVVRALGRLAIILGKLDPPRPDNLITLITGYLLNIICSKEEHVWIIAEALDVMFDVFEADYDLDNVSQEISLMEKLTQVLPSLKKRIKLEKRTYTDNLPPVLSTANINLSNFIKHKNLLNNKK